MISSRIRRFAIEDVIPVSDSGLIIANLNVIARPPSWRCISSDKIRTWASQKPAAIAADVGDGKAVWGGEGRVDSQGALHGVPEPIAESGFNRSPQVIVDATNSS